MISRNSYRSHRRTGAGRRRELGVLGVGDVIGQVAGVVRGEGGVPRPRDDQGRHLDGGQDGAYVDVEPLPRHRGRGGRAGGHPLDLRVPPAEILVGGHRRVGEEQVRTRAPGAQHRRGDLVRLGALYPVGVVRVLAQPGVARHEDQGFDPFGVGGRVDQGGRAAGQVSREHRPLAAGLVQDHAQVVDLLVHGRRRAAGDRIGQSRAPVVVQDEPAERGQPAQPPRGRRFGPHEVDVRGGSGGDPDQVDRSLTQYLVGEVDGAVAGVAGLGRAGHRTFVLSSR